jgi:hypothetical protein
MYTFELFSKDVNSNPFSRFKIRFELNEGGEVVAWLYEARNASSPHKLCDQFTLSHKDMDELLARHQQHRRDDNFFQDAA